MKISCSMIIPPVLITTLSRATDIAHSMVKEYGMGESGSGLFCTQKKIPLSQSGPEGAEEYSETTAKLIDGEIRGIIGKHYTKLKIF